MRAPTTLAKLLLIAVVASVATTGCVTKGDLSSTGVAPDHQTAVRIHNYNESDVRVYLVPASGGIPLRLRTITSMTTLRIPLRGPIGTELQIHGSLRFLIRPLDNPSESYTTRSVIMTPGEVMSLTVANQLVLSTLAVGSR